jgi:cobalt/nickel transport system permease protein
MVSALRSLKVPSIFIVLLEFILRYFSLFKEEMDTMITARKCRGFKARGFLKSVREISKIIGWAFVRAYNRSLRIYNSMISRGFDGEFKYGELESPGALDYMFAASFVILGASLIILDRSGFLWNMPLK